MFDIGFSELIVIAIVALVVVGPERLPKVARTAGHLLGRLQRYVNDVKSDISREMRLDELKKLQSEMQDSAHSLERSVSSQMQAVEQVVEQAAQSVTGEGVPAASPGDMTSATGGADASLATGETPAPVDGAAQRGVAAAEPKG